MAGTTEAPQASEPASPSQDAAPTSELELPAAARERLEHAAALEPSPEVSPRGEELPSESMSVVAETSNGDMAEVQQLQYERGILLHDVGTLKAKFELTLQTLCSTLGLDSGAGWADILEGCETLALKKCGVPEVGEEALWQAEKDIEQLEEKVEDQTEYIAHLRELLQKQQGLLDMTTQQFESHDRRDHEQAEKILAYETRDVSMQETMASQECRIAELMAQFESCQNQLREQSALACERDAKLQAKLAHNKALEAELAREEALLSFTEGALEALRRENFQLHQETAAEIERQDFEIRELEGAMSDKTMLVDKMAEQLQVFEAAERRRYSYRPGPRVGSTASLEDDQSMLGSEQGSVCSASVSALTSLAPSAAASASTTPLPSSRGPRGQVGGPPPASNSTGSSGDMAVEERIKFLAHFPMASRTERQFRNTFHDRQRPAHRSAAGA